MAIRMVVKVQLDDMAPTVIYPIEGFDQERIAMLTGIIQLVSAALEMGRSKPDKPRFMKSEQGVIGYCQKEPFLIICEGDNENETGEALKAVLDDIEISGEALSSKLESIVKQRGKEIGDLWR